MFICVEVFAFIVAIYNACACNNYHLCIFFKINLRLYNNDFTTFCDLHILT